MTGELRIVNFLTRGQRFRGKPDRARRVMRFFWLPRSPSGMRWANSPAYSAEERWRDRSLKLIEAELLLRNAAPPQSARDELLDTSWQTMATGRRLSLSDKRRALLQQPSRRFEQRTQVAFGHAASRINSKGGKRNPERSPLPRHPRERDAFLPIPLHDAQDAWRKFSKAPRIARPRLRQFLHTTWGVQGVR